MRIEYLADHPQVIDLLAQWAHDEWAYLRPGITREQVADEFRERAVKDRVPITLLVMTDQDVVGTISIKAHENATRPGLSPWIGGVYVRSDWRGKGLGKLMMSAAEVEARRLGLQALHLSATDAQAFYEKLGWQVIERRQCQGEDIAVMRKQLV